MAKYSWLFYVAAALILWNAAVLIRWHSVSQNLTMSETIEYLPIGQKVYQSLTARPDVRPMAEAMDWKGILQPLLIVPFLFLTSGHVLLATWLFSAVFSVLSTLILWLLLRKFLDRDRAILVLAFFWSVPWVYQSAHLFNPELPLIFFTVAGLWVSVEIRRGGGRVWALAFGLCMAFGFCSRPLEALALGPVFLAVICSRRRFSAREALVAGIASLVSCVFLFWSWGSPQAQGVDTAGFGVALFLAGLAFAARSTILGLAASVGWIPTVLWWDSHIAKIVNWIYVCTLTKFTGESKRVDGDHWNYLWGFLKTIGGMHAIFLVVALVWLGRPVLARVVKRREAWVTLGVASLSLGFGLKSLNDDYRYFVCVGTLIFIPAAILAVDRGWRSAVLVVPAVLSLGVATTRAWSLEGISFLDTAFSGSVWFGRGNVTPFDRSDYTFLDQFKTEILGRGNLYLGSDYNEWMYILLLQERLPEVNVRPLEAADCARFQSEGVRTGDFLLVRVAKGGAVACRPSGQGYAEKRFPRDDGDFVLTRKI